MKTIFLLLALAVVVATPALAAERTKTYRVEIPVLVRTEIYLRESKRETAAKAVCATVCNGKGGRAPEEKED